MRAAVIVFPGSNCDRDMVEALRQSGADVAKVWHKDAELPQGLRSCRASRRVFLWRLPAVRRDCGAISDLPGRGRPCTSGRLCLGGLQRVSSFERNRSGSGRLDAQFWVEVPMQNCRIDR